MSEKIIIVDESPRQKDMSAREVLNTALTNTLAMASHNFSKVLKRPKMHQGQSKIYDIARNCHGVARIV